MPVTLFVCTTCRRADNVDDATTESCGSKLRRELEARDERPRRALDRTLELDRIGCDMEAPTVERTVGKAMLTIVLSMTISARQLASSTRASQRRS